MTITPIVSQALNDLTVAPNATDTRIDLFANFDDPSTTGLVAQFDLYNADLGGGITEVLLFDQPGVGAPITVQNFVGYVERNEYVDTVIHRSVPGFIIQGGGFAIEGIDTASVSEIADTVTVITGPTIQNEFSTDRSNLRGTIAMAKVGGNPDSATSQWFFNLADNSANLDSQNGGFTVFGEVLSEADLAPLDAIATLPRFNASQIFNQAAFGTMPLNIDLAVSNELTSDDQLARYEDIIVFDRPELTFTILNNSNPTLVNASIAAGQLILDYGDNQIGSAEITIQATTLLGESIQDTFVITVEDTVAPVINVDQTFSYPENQTAGYVIGNVVASDNIEVTGFTIVGNNNGFFAIDSNGNITLTDLGAASIINDFETAPNSFFLEIIATDAVNNSSEATSLTLTILDVEEVIPVPTVTIATTDADATEEGLDPGEFTITLSEAAATDITVSYGVTGTATATSDYTALSGTVTIAAGQTTATIAVTPVDDAVTEDAETVVVNLTDGDAYDPGATTAATVTIADNDPVVLPTVTIAATDADAAEEGLDPGEFTITLSEAAATDITVSYAVTGTATATSDYTALSGTVTIAAGQTTATIAITPIDDLVVEDSETIIITLVDGDNYDLGATIEGTVTIANDDVALPSVSLAVSPASVQENGTANLVYTFTRAGATTSTLTVNYTVAGTADNSDYTGTSTGIGKTVTFAAGSSTAIVTVDPTTDTTVESDETVILTLVSGTDYTIATTSAVVGTIANDDTRISLAVSPTSITEDGTRNLTYTFTRSGILSNTLTVNYSIAGTADASDYTGATPGTGKTIVFETGSSTATVTIDPTADTTIESNETVSLTLADGSGYTIGTPTAVTGTIANDEVVAQETTVLLGTPQEDTLDATTGQYTVIPLTGDDTIEVNTASDVIIELPNEGTDTIVSSVNYNLAALTHIENLTLTGTDDITGIGNRRDNIITGNSGQNVLVGLQGDDTFVFNFGDSTVAKPDRIRDFGVGQDRIQIGSDRLLAPSELPSTTNNTATVLTDLVNSVFADADGILSGNQPLAIDSAAFVTSTVSGIAGTYLVVNDETAGFNAETDLIINIGSISVIF